MRKAGRGGSCGRDGVAWKNGDVGGRCVFLSSPLFCHHQRNAATARRDIQMSVFLMTKIHLLSARSKVPALNGTAPTSRRSICNAYRVSVGQPKPWFSFDKSIYSSSVLCSVSSYSARSARYSACISTFEELGRLDSKDFQERINEALKPSPSNA